MAAAAVITPFSAVAAAVVTTAAVAVPSAGAAAAASAYVSMPTPTRLLDSRLTGPSLPAGFVVNLKVTGDAPLPPTAGTTAVVLNVTVVGPAGVGFWTVSPSGRPRPLAASLYVDERASLLGGALAVPNLVTVPVGADGSVDIYTQRGGHVVVDMLGSYQASDATAAGRLQPLQSPARIHDTRSSAVVPAGGTLDIRVPDAGGASAAVLSVTTIALAAGYWTVFPAGTTPPTAANLNSLHGLHIVANQVIVPLDAEGDFSVFSQSGGHVIVDLVALVTGAGSPVSTDGLFVPLGTPTRFLDTREAATNPLGGAQMLRPGWNLEVPVASNPAVGRPDVAALALNLTVTDPLAGGYVTVAPAGSSAPGTTTRPTATVTVVRAAQTLASHATVAVSPRGFEVFALNGGHVIADVAGYYLGTPVGAPHGTPKNAQTTPAGCGGPAAAPVGAIVPGSSPESVRRAQQRLLDLGFWNAGADGGYGLTTSQAVMAFQKWAGLPRTTVIDETTAVRLNTTACRPSPGVSGDAFEVDKSSQIAFIVRGGQTVWVLNVSTGGDYYYTAIDDNDGSDASGWAITPVGTYSVYRVHDQAQYKGSLGTLYRPRFVVGGVAVHGYPSVPNYPASHGCIRVSNPAMDMIWATNAMPLRSRVVIHD